MIDIVYPLQKAYMLILAGITYNSVAVPVFYQITPDNQPNNYIVFGQIRDADNSCMTDQFSLANVTVKIHTASEKYNSGAAVAKIADQVLQKVYPLHKTIDLSADKLQLFSTKKTQDFTEDWTLQNQIIYIDRTLQFTHNIHYLN